MLKPVSDQDHIQGPNDAPVTLVEYGDYQCPYCKKAHLIVKQVQKKLGDQLRFVYRNFPLVELHPYALNAAITAEFAASKNKFWEMHDILFENQQNLEIHDLLGYAESLGLPKNELQRSLQEEAFADKIRDDFMGGVRSGVNGTPTFFINGERYNGSYEYEDLLAVLKDKQK